MELTITTDRSKRWTRTLYVVDKEMFACIFQILKEGNETTQPAAKSICGRMRMNINRAQELLVPLKNGTANGISLEWSARLIEALEYVIEHEAAQPAAVCDHDWITVVLSPLTRRCRKCGVER